MFNGLAAEIPLDHIENFERVCNFSRANGVPPDYVKCTLFPFSLDVKASRWLVSLPTGTLTKWEHVRAAFLRHFYTKRKTAALGIISQIVSKRLTSLSMMLGSVLRSTEGNALTTGLRTITYWKCSMM